MSNQKGLKFYESPFHVTHDQVTADRMMREVDKRIKRAKRKRT
jgi:hypothetical protein